MEKKHLIAVIASMAATLSETKLFATSTTFAKWARALSNNDEPTITKLHSRLFRIYSSLSPDCHNEKAFYSSIKVETIIDLIQAVSGIMNPDEFDTLFVLENIHRAAKKTASLGIHIPITQRPTPSYCHSNNNIALTA